MKKIIIILVVFVLLSALSIAGIITIQNNSYNSALASVQNEKKSVEAQIEKINGDKDSNDFLPTDIVKYFIVELKNGSNERAKLYISKDKQSQDPKAWLSIDKDFGAADSQDLTYNIEDDIATVQVTLVFNGSDKVNRTFTLVKEDNLWKISDIKE